MNIIILGGHGFVGKNVVEVFKESEYKIIPLSRINKLDLLNYYSTKTFFEEFKPKFIINCAAKVGSLNYVSQQAADILDINMRMLLNIYRAAHEFTPESIILNPIANCAFPGKLETYTEESLWEGKFHQSVTSYGSVRRMIPIISECYEMQHGFRSINFFVPNMYGPFDSTDPNKAHALNALISKFVKTMYEDLNHVEVWGSGIAIREWLFAPDCGKIFLYAINKIEESGLADPINIGQNFGLSIRELVNIIIDEIGFKGNIIWNRVMPDGAPRKVMSDHRFKKFFHDFKFTELREGVRKTIKYYESIYPY